jgi:uncharacterized membrane protein (DUF106 family)
MTIKEVIITNPTLSLFIIAATATLISTLIHKWMTNQEHLKNLKARQKELQQEIRKNKKNPDAMKELQLEMMKLSGVMFKSSMRPLFITIIPFLLLFTWLRGIYPPILNHWIWWYLGFSIGTSIITRKILKVH